MFLSSCVRSFPWVSESLLPWHNAEQISTLHQWTREPISQAADESAVPESITFADRQKIVFVESRRLEATMACIDEVKRLLIRDLVLFFDWRVLEDWQEVESKESQVDVPDSRKRAVLETRFFGFTCWSTERRKVVFMHRDLARMPRAWLDDA